jgi:hypothetical protein
LTNPIRLQRLEGLLLLVAAVWLFAETRETWWLFGLLLLAPDISMLGYLHSPETGAAIYNLGHTLLVPAAMLAWGVLAEVSLLVGVGAVWVAHIGMDRFAGYGMKYSDSFHHTHLGMIGPARRGQAGENG